MDTNFVSIWFITLFVISRKLINHSNCPKPLASQIHQNVPADKISPDRTVSQWFHLPSYFTPRVYQNLSQSQQQEKPGRASSPESIRPTKRRKALPGCNRSHFFGSLPLPESRSPGKAWFIAFILSGFFSSAVLAVGVTLIEIYYTIISNYSDNDNPTLHRCLLFCLQNISKCFCFVMSRNLRL